MLKGKPKQLITPCLAIHMRVYRVETEVTSSLRKFPFPSDVPVCPSRSSGSLPSPLPGAAAAMAAPALSGLHRPHPAPRPPGTAWARAGRHRAGARWANGAGRQGTGTAISEGHGGGGLRQQNLTRKNPPYLPEAVSPHKLLVRSSQPCPAPPSSLSPQFLLLSSHTQLLATS